MPLRIVLCYPVQPDDIALIQSVAPDATLVDAGQERIDAELPSADIFCGHAKVPVDWDRVVNGGRLKWIQSSAAGMDHCLVPSVVQSDILVTSASGLFAPQVAEQTLAILLALIRRLPAFLRAQRRRRFERLPTDDLRGKTVGIVGLGGNGRRIAQVLAPFGVRLLATDRFPVQKPAEVEALWEADRLPDLLSASDIIILTLPLNSQTRGLFNLDMLKQCRPGSLLINVARGPIIVEDDLVVALDSGHLAAAGLDVTEVEPLPASSLLWDHENVIITPHVGAQSARRVRDTTELFCHNLKSFLEKRPLTNVVDKQLGFPIPTGSRC